MPRQLPRVRLRLPNVFRLVATSILSIAMVSILIRVQDSGDNDFLGAVEGDTASNRPPQNRRMEFRSAFVRIWRSTRINLVAIGA
jgi:hypothetical protein